DLATAVALIDKCFKPHAVKMPGALFCDVAKKVRNDALRKIVSLDLIGDRQLLQFRHQPPMPADHAAHQTFVAKVIESPVVAVTLTSGVDQREIARLAGGRDRLITFREIQRFYCQSDFFGESDTDKTTCGNRVTVSNEAGCFLCRDNLSAIQCFDGRKRESNCIS